MENVLIPHRSEKGWVLDIPSEMAQEMGVMDGSFAVLTPRQGGIEIEVLSPPSRELKSSVYRIAEKYREVFEVLDRHGD